MSIEFTETNLQNITENTERAKSNTHRIEKCESDIKELQEENKALYSIANSIEILCHKTEEIKDLVDENCTDIKGIQTEIVSIKNQPFKLKSAIYDKVVGAILGAIGMGVLGFVLYQIAPNIFK